jgi:hypothetical protein
MRYEMAKRFNNCNVIPAKAGIQHSRAPEIESQALGLLDARWSLSSGRALRGPVGGHDGV